MNLQNKTTKEISKDIQYWIFQFDDYSLFLKQEFEEDHLSSSFQDVINQYKGKNNGK